jgi:hypothetical protein
VFGQSVVVMTSLRQRLAQAVDHQGFDIKTLTMEAKSAFEKFG